MADACISFLGSAGAYCSAAANTNVPTAADVSVEVWAKAASSWNNAYALVSKGGRGNNGGWTIRVSFNSIEVNVMNASTNQQVTASISGLSVALHHFAFTYTHSTKAVKIYRDGSPLTVSGSPTANTMTSNASGVEIGRQTGGGTEMNGLIDEVRIWNTVRSDSDIANNYNVDLGVGFSANLVDYYRMNENTGTTSADDGGDGNTRDLTLNGSVSWTTPGAITPSGGAPAQSFVTWMG